MKLLTRMFLIAAALTMIVYVPASLAEVNRLDAPHDSTNAMDCGSCHVPVGTIPAPRNWLSNVVCATCHAAGGVATTATVHAQGDTMMCENCHNPHQHQAGYAHNYLKNEVVLPDGRSKAMAFRDSADFIHEATGVTVPYDGVCETCHTNTSIFRNNASGVHPTTASLGQHAGSDKCTNCHKHDDGFKATRQATLCLSCHTDMVARLDTTRSAYHPILGIGKNSVIAKVESMAAVTNKMLVTPSWWSNASTATPTMTSTSKINCTDCHGDSTASNGLHGLSYTISEGGTTSYPQLKRSYVPGMNQEEGANFDLVADAVCYACHDPYYYRTSASSRPNGYLKNDSIRFSRHNTHVTYNSSNTQERQEACLECHGAHGGPTAAQELTGRVGLVRWSKKYTGRELDANGVMKTGWTQRDSLTNPDSTYRIGSGANTVVGRSALFGYYRLVNKYIPPIAPRTSGLWGQPTRDTAIVNSNGDTIADYIVNYCYVNCHTGKDSLRGTYVNAQSNNHFGRTVVYKRWR